MALAGPAGFSRQGMHLEFGVSYLLTLLQKFDAASKNRVRSFGHVRLCGALHACWQTKDGVEGQYFICLLYRDVLCLASAGKVDPIYTIHACINLNGIKVENVDNGRGQQQLLAACAPSLTGIRAAMSHGTILMEACLRVRPSAVRDDHDGLYSQRGDGVANKTESVFIGGPWTGRASLVQLPRRRDREPGHCLWQTWWVDISKLT